MDYKIIPGIDPINDGFTFNKHGLNCFLVVKYIASKTFHVNGPDLFYLYVYMLKHYDVYKHLGAPFDLTAWDTDIAKYRLESKVGLRTYTLPLEENDQQIRSFLDKGWPVFIPINRGEIYYYPFFQKRNEPALLLIKGYNPNNNIFVIQDIVQNYHLLQGQSSQISGDIYSQFYMPYDMLLYAHKSYNDNFEYLNKKMQFICPIPMKDVEKNEEALETTFKIFENKENSTEFLIEKKFLKIENTNIDQLQGMIMYINTHQIFIYQIVKILKEKNYPNNLVEEICNLGLAAWKTWKDYITFIGIKAIKSLKNQDKMLWQRQLIIEAETNFIRALNSIALFNQS